MWKVAGNRTDELWFREISGNTSQRAILEQLGLSFAVAHSNGSQPGPGTLTAAPPTQKTSGIVPGLIAAGLFILFLLGLYALLWRCMVSQPSRRQRKERARARGKPDPVC
ncbi:uncharacterized protein [Paramormyrops kingsleyae]|uniref:uncharacterized protein n=1 Tax=Paramormyrops kingsleyae TaxID=1676925 RepID=UPI003B978A06